jgi:hypothetical protein
MPHPVFIQRQAEDSGGTQDAVTVNASSFFVFLLVVFLLVAFLLAISLLAAGVGVDTVMALEMAVTGRRQNTLFAGTSVILGNMAWGFVAVWGWGNTAGIRLPLYQKQDRGQAGPAPRRTDGFKTLPYNDRCIYTTSSQRLNLKPILRAVPIVANPQDL